MLKIRRKHGTNRNSWEAITVEHSRSDRTLSVPESGIPHGQLEGDDVADTSCGDQTRPTEFVGLVAERGEGNGRCMRFEVVWHAYTHFRWDGDDIRRIGHTFVSNEILTQNDLLSAPPICTSFIYSTMSFFSPPPSAFKAPAPNRAEEFLSRDSSFAPSESTASTEGKSSPFGGRRLRVERQ